MADDERAASGARPRPERAAAERPRAHVEPLAELTTTGGAVAALVPVTLAAIIDVAISPGLGVLFAFVFILSSVLVALRISWRDAWAAVAFPPLIFIAAAGVAAQVSSVSTGSWLQRTSGEMATAVLGHPYALLIGTVLAAGAVVYRARTEYSARE